MPDPQQPVRDAGIAVDAGVCELNVPAVGRVVEGQIFVPDLPPDTTIDWPDDFVDLGDRARVPYGRLGPVDIAVTSACGATATLRIGIAPIVHEVLPVWADGDGPDAREHPVMWIDPNDADRLLLFGGFSFVPRQFTVVSDLWAYDFEASTWTSVATVDAPELAAGRLAIDPATGIGHYDGGSDQNNASPFSLRTLDTSVSPAAWTSVAPVGAPAEGASLHGFVRAGDRYLSIGGFRGRGPSNAVFVYDQAAGTYESLTVAGDPPSARYGFFVTYDEPNDRVIVYGGAQNPAPGNSVNPASDTWALELAEDPPRWRMLIDGAEGPPGRRNGCSAHDVAHRRFFVWGGTPDARSTAPGLWVLDLDRDAEKWTQILPEMDGVVRASCSGTYDEKRNRLIFGFGNNTQGIYADLVAVNLQ